MAIEQFGKVTKDERFIHYLEDIEKSNRDRIPKLRVFSKKQNSMEAGQPMYEQYSMEDVKKDLELLMQCTI